MEFPMVCDARWSGHDVEGMHRQERGREGTDVEGVVGGARASNVGEHIWGERRAIDGVGREERELSFIKLPQEDGGGDGGEELVIGGGNENKPHNWLLISVNIS